MKIFKQGQRGNKKLNGGLENERSNKGRRITRKLGVR